MLGLEYSRVSLALYLAGVHSPARWNRLPSSQDWRWHKCPQWQDRRWPSQLLPKPTGCQPVPQPGLALAPACWSYTSCNAGGRVGKHWQGQSPSWLWGASDFKTPSEYQMGLFGCFITLHHEKVAEGLAYILSLAAASSRQRIISLGDLSQPQWVITPLVPPPPSPCLHSSRDWPKKHKPFASAAPNGPSGVISQVSIVQTDQSPGRTSYIAPLCLPFLMPLSAFNVLAASVLPCHVCPTQHWGPASCCPASLAADAHPALL